MVARISKVLLLVALLAMLVVSSAPAFSTSACQCFSFKCPGGFCKGGSQTGGCQFNKDTSQCVNTGCKGVCF